jgi:hypothetical protein
MLYIKHRGINMEWTNNKKLIAIFTAVLIFSVISTSGSRTSNSESSFDGTTQPSRQVAAQTIETKPEESTSTTSLITKQEVTKFESDATETMQDEDVAAAVQEELELKLAGVINPVKYKKGLTASQFNGSLLTNNGTIESLSISLPNNEGLSISFSEMKGNVFEYEFDGEVLSGMIYQADQNSYMITFNNGPLEGTRLNFLNVNPTEQVPQNEQLLAQVHNAE